MTKMVQQNREEEKKRLVGLLKAADSQSFNAMSISIDYYYEQLADNLLDGGVIVPPCKVGDTVYIIPSRVDYDLNQQFGRQAENRVHVQVIDEIRFNLNGYYIVTAVNYVHAGAYHGAAFHDTWFLSREAAEQALKEMEQ